MLEALSALLFLRQASIQAKSMQHLQAFLNRKSAGSDYKVRGGRGFVRITNAREIWNQTLTGFAIQTLRVTLAADLDGTLQKNLIELALCESAAHAVAVCHVRGDEGRNHHQSSLYQQASDFSGTAQILGAVLGAESKVVA